MTEQALRALATDFLITFLIGSLFLLLFGAHQWDMRRRRRRVAAMREAGAFGPRSQAVKDVVASAGQVGAAAARALAAERRRAFEWDPRLNKIPKVARTARDRAFANERDDVARAAAEEARDAMRRALSGEDLDDAVRSEAAECAAETAGAIVAADRIPATDFRMLTRAWRSVLGPVGATPRREF
jgi:hypothetical protein